MFPLKKEWLEFARDCDEVSLRWVEFARNGARLWFGSVLFATSIAKSITGL